MELTPSHRRLLAGGALAVVALVVLAPRMLHGDGAGRSVVPLRVATRLHASPAELVVDVAGAVRRPGVYHVPAGTRIVDAIAAAGGATRKADVTLVDLAAPLADGEQVLVPARGTAGAGGGGPTAGATAPLDLNTATADQLDALPGIGPATAQKIIDFRQAHGPFRTVDELDGVSGIGAAKLAQLKGLVVP